LYLGIFFDLGIYLIFLVFQRFFLNIRNPHNLLISVSSFRLLFRVAYARLMNPIFFQNSILSGLTGFLFTEFWMS